MKVANDIKI